MSAAKILKKALYEGLFPEKSPSKRDFYIRPPTFSVCGQPKKPAIGSNSLRPTRRPPTSATKRSINNPSAAHIRHETTGIQPADVCDRFAGTPILPAGLLRRLKKARHRLVGTLFRRLRQPEKRGRNSLPERLKTVPTCPKTSQTAEAKKGRTGFSQEKTDIPTK